MNNKLKELNACACDTQRTCAVDIHPVSTKIAPSLGSLLLTLLIAFFPKCPMCWAMYMSLLSGFGLAQMPYSPWLFFALLGVLGLYLIMLFKQAPQQGYAPFALCVSGSAFILSGRLLLEYDPWLLTVMGIGLILLSSLWALLRLWLSRFIPAPAPTFPRTQFLQTTNTDDGFIGH